MFDHLSSSTAEPTNHHISQFLCCLNPTVEALQWLLTHHMDEAIMNWHCPTPVLSNSVAAGHVLMDIQNLRSMLDLCSTRFVFVQAVESIYDTLGQMATIH